MEVELLLYWEPTCTIMEKRHWVIPEPMLLGGFKLFSVPDAHQMKGLATTSR